LSLAADLRSAQAAWILVDSTGRVVDGDHAVGEELASWLPGWTVDGVDEPRRSRDDRWVRLHRLADSDDSVLYLVLDRTCEHVLAEARLLAERRRAQAALAGATAREMNDAMTIVQGRLELLRSFALEDPASADRHCAIALEHAQHAVETLHDLRLVGAVNPVDVSPVSVLETARAALVESGLPTERVQIDVHPNDIDVLGRPGPLKRVFTTVFRALGSGRDNVAFTARRSVECIRVDVSASGRRRTDLDGLQLGIIAALVDALGGSLTQTSGGLELELPSESPDHREVGTLAFEGRMLVVGHPYLADRVSRLLAPDPVEIHLEPTAEAAIKVVGDDEVVGVISQLILPERCGLRFYRQVQQARPDLPLGPLVVTSDAIKRLPRDVRCVSGPFTRSRLVRALTA